MNEPSKHILIAVYIPKRPIGWLVVKNSGLPREENCYFSSELNMFNRLVLVNPNSHTKVNFCHLQKEMNKVTPSSCYKYHIDARWLWTLCFLLLEMEIHNSWDYMIYKQCEANKTLMAFVFFAPHSFCGGILLLIILIPFY